MTHTERWVSDLAAACVMIALEAAMDSDLIWTLLGRPEGSSLDFKRQPCSLANKAERAEFAKDLCAMANVLSPDQSPAYILIGVDEDPATHRGVLVGILEDEGHEDADLHRRVRPLLNRSPKFSYTQDWVDCENQRFLIGIVEIRPGGRPFFRTSGNENGRNVAWYRDGSHTESADPDMITQWAHEDDSLARKAAELQVQPMVLFGNPGRGKTTNDAWSRIVPVVNASKVPVHVEMIEVWPEDSDGNEIGPRRQPGEQPILVRTSGQGTIPVAVRPHDPASGWFAGAYACVRVRLSTADGTESEVTKRFQMH